MGSLRRRLFQLLVLVLLLNNSVLGGGGVDKGKKEDRGIVRKEKEVRAGVAEVKKVGPVTTDTIKGNIEGVAEPTKADKKATSKRDLPLLIQSSPANHNLLRGFTPIYEPGSDYNEQQRADTEFNGNAPHVFIAKPGPTPQQIAFGQASGGHQHNELGEQVSASQLNYHAHPPNHQVAATAGTAPAVAQSSPTASYLTASPQTLTQQQFYYNPHNSPVHETASSPSSGKPYFNSYATAPQITILASAPSNKYAAYVPQTSPYSHLTQISYPTSAATYSSPQYVGYATTVQPQIVQYPAYSSPAVSNSPYAQQLYPIPHNQPIGAYTYQNPAIANAHNQNLYASTLTKISNPAAFNHASGQSLYQLSPYAYPVQTSYQVASKPTYLVPQQQQQPQQFHPNQYQQQNLQPTPATPQYKQLQPVVGSTAGYTGTRNEVPNHLANLAYNQQQIGAIQQNGVGSSVGSIKVNPYVSQQYVPQVSSNAIYSTSYPKAVQAYVTASPLQQQQQQQVSQQQQQQSQQLYPSQYVPAQSQNVASYYYSQQQFYPNKYQSTYGQIGGTPHKVLYSPH